MCLEHLREKWIWRNKRKKEAKKNILCEIIFYFWTNDMQYACFCLLSTRSIHTDPNTYNAFSPAHCATTDRWKYFLKTLLGVKLPPDIFSAKSVTIWVKLIGPGASPTYRWGISSIQNKWFRPMFSPSFSVFLRYYKTSSHHVVCLAIADWPSNTLDGVVITIFLFKWHRSQF